jgi:hypothetical protein
MEKKQTLAYPIDYSIPLNPFKSTRCICLGERRKEVQYHFTYMQISIFGFIDGIPQGRYYSVG